MTGGSAKSISGSKDPDEYHTSFATVMAVNVVLLVLLIEFFFPGLIADFLAAVPFNAAELLHFLIAYRLRVLGFLLFSVVLIIVHELIHVAAHKRNEFDHSYGVIWVRLWKLPNPVPYVVVLDDPLTRKENITALLAPVLVLTAVGLVGLLPLFPDVVTFYAKILLVVNTAGSSGDFYNSVKVARYPPETLFLNVESGNRIRTFTYKSK